MASIATTLVITNWNNIGSPVGFATCAYGFALRNTLIGSMICANGGLLRITGPNSTDPNSSQSITVTMSDCLWSGQLLSPSALPGTYTWTVQFLGLNEYLPSDPLTMTTVVFPSGTDHNVVFQNLSLSPSSITPGQSITLSGTVVNGLGTPIPNLPLELLSSPYAGISSTTFQSDGSGHFNTVFTPCVNYEFCGGPQWVQVIHYQDADYYRGTSEQIPYAVSDTAAMMLCLPQYDIFPPGSNVGIGFELLYPDLSPMVGKSVRVRIINLGTGATIYDRTVTSVSGYWQDAPLISTPGDYQALYDWAGDATYSATNCTADFSVGECSAPQYQTCQDGTTIMVQECVNYEYVPTGDSCTTPVQTLVSVQVTPLNAQGDVLPWGVVGGIVRLSINTTDALGNRTYNPVNVMVMAPDNTYPVPNSPYYDFYPQTTGTHIYIVQVSDWYANGKLYKGTTASGQFYVKECLNGQLSDPLVCDDNSTIYQSVCQNGVYVDSGQACPNYCDTNPEPECRNGFIYECVDGVWSKTTEQCGPVYECRLAHPSPECINDEVWDCDESGNFSNTFEACGKTCEQQHPNAPECFGGTWWNCVGGIWMDTGVSCDEPPPVDNTMLLVIGAVGIGAAAVGAYMLTAKKGKGKK